MKNKVKDESEFKLTDLRSGLVLNMSTKSWYGWLIRRVLAHDWDDPNECPNHDAIVVEVDGKLMIGESQPPVAKLTSIEEYERDIRSGFIYRIRILEVSGVKRKQEVAAARWWLEHVNNSPYDYMAFPRLLFKAMFGNLINSVAGWTWARWCTEGVAESWKQGGKFDAWKIINPTPLTTYKRMKQGVFRMILYEGKLK